MNEERTKEERRIVEEDIGQSYLRHAGPILVWYYPDPVILLKVIGKKGLFLEKSQHAG